MKQQGLLLIGIAVLIALGGFLLMKQRVAAPSPAPDSTETTASEEARTFAWRFQTTENDDGMAPSTKVALITGGQVYNLGSFMGSCAEIASENLLAGEKAGVLCWFAGGGEEIGVFEADGQLVVRVGAQEEGTAESPGFRGNFRDVVELQ